MAFMSLCIRALLQEHSLVLFGPPREKTCLWRFANNTGADQLAHPRSLISAFVVRYLESIICKLCCRWNINSLSSLCSWGDWFETRFDGNPEDRFSCDEVIFLTVDDDEGSDKKGNVAASNNYTCMFEVWLRNCMIGIIISWAGHIYYAFKSVVIWLKQ